MKYEYQDQGFFKGWMKLRKNGAITEISILMKLFLWRLDQSDSLATRKETTLIFLGALIT